MVRNAPALLAVALRRFAAALVVLVLGYLAAALVGGVVPANAGWRPARSGDPGAVTIWVESNGIHTGLVMPKVASGVDWRALAPAGDLGDPRYGRWGHVAIGWGEKGFYLGTPTWRDLRPGVALRAVTGSSATLMHVEHVPGPAADARAVVLTGPAYRKLAAFVAASFRPGGRRYPGYDANDAFYDARGRYDAVRTCNSWMGEALRAAGVRVGVWTPLPVSVMGWFPVGDAAPGLGG